MTTKQRKMRVAKASEEDIQALSAYFLAKEAKNVKSIPTGWRRVVWAARILISACCDPFEDHLEQSPYLETRHVANEQ